MPDIHWGYGFPIGGCCATDPNQGGVISPGGVGYDINCGVRLMRTNLKHEEVAPRIRELVAQLFRDIPCGLGRGSDLKLSIHDEKQCVHQGAHWAVEHGFGEPEDLDFIEERGQLADAEPSNITERALERGKGQLGSLGSGNHFLEVQVVDEMFDEDAADVMGSVQGTDHRDDSLRFARVRLPGVRRLSEGAAQRAREVRDSSARPPACQRAGAFA